MDNIPICTHVYMDGRKCGTRCIKYPELSRCATHRFRKETEQKVFRKCIHDGCETMTSSKYGHCRWHREEVETKLFTDEKDNVIYARLTPFGKKPFEIITINGAKIENEK